MTHPDRNHLLLSALLALAGTTACAAWSAPNEAKAAPEEPNPVVAAIAPSRELLPEAQTRPTAYPPLEAGVRHAADRGPEALRRYILRTRMIYNYRFDDFARDSW